MGRIRSGGTAAALIAIGCATWGIRCGGQALVEERSAARDASAGSGGSGGTVPFDAGPLPEAAPDVGGSGGDSGGTGGTSGAGGTGGASGAGGAGGACTPQCAGRVCGADACGSTCPPGCPPNETCSIDGQCEDLGCTDTWVASAVDTFRGVAVEPGGNVYVTGDEGVLGWIGAYSPCTGTLLDATSIASSIATLTRLRRLWAHAVAPSGNVWLVGVSDRTINPLMWGLKGSSEGIACGFTMGDTPGQGRNVVIDGSDVYLTGVVEDRMVLHRFDDAACFTTGPCPCAPVWSSPPITVGTAHTEPRGMVIVGTSVYLAGFSTNDDGDAFGFVANVDVTTGTVSGVYRWNATGKADRLLDLATDGQSLYAVGYRGWESGQPLDDAAGVVMALPPAHRRCHEPAMDDFAHGMDRCGRHCGRRLERRRTVPDAVGGEDGRARTLHEGRCLSLRRMSLRGQGRPRQLRDRPALSLTARSRTRRASRIPPR